MTNNAFWEKYFTIVSDSESKQFLKDYLFSLPPNEMKNWLLSNTQSIVEDLKGHLQDPSVSEAWKADFKEQLKNSVFNIQNIEKFDSQRKAA
jgi:superfamily I DNA/RNA helicase